MQKEVSQLTEDVSRGANAGQSKLCHTLCVMLLSLAVLLLSRNKPRTEDIDVN